MRSYLPLLFAAAIIIVGGILVLRFYRQGESLQNARRQAVVGCRQAATAYGEKEVGVWVTVTAHVARLLADESGHLQHQRFIVACKSGQTLEIVNDVSIGERVPVHPGDRVTVHGEYVWNSLGGLIHFTHHAEGGGTGGWILFRSRVYALSPSVPTLRTTPVARV